MTGKFPIVLAVMTSLISSTSCTPSSADQAGQNAPSTAAPGFKKATVTPAKPGEDRCASSDPEFLCLGIRYVAFKDESGKAAVSEKQAKQTIRDTNDLWAQCKIGFQIDKYEAVNSSDHGIRYRIGDYAELDDIRSAFADKRELLVSITGKWDRSGSLGDTGANAWTAMPGGPPYGAVLEQSVGTFSNIVAHELGHYLNLYHSNDSSELMNPTIYTRSKKITPQQCAIARKTASASWSQMLR